MRGGVGDLDPWFERGRWPSKIGGGSIGGGADFVFLFLFIMGLSSAVPSKSARHSSAAKSILLSWIVVAIIELITGNNYLLLMDW